MSLSFQAKSNSILALFQIMFQMQCGYLGETHCLVFGQGTLAGGCNKACCPWCCTAVQSGPGRAQAGTNLGMRNTRRVNSFLQPFHGASKRHAEVESTDWEGGRKPRKYTKYKSQSHFFKPAGLEEWQAERSYILSLTLPLNSYEWGYGHWAWKMIFKNNSA